MNNIFLIATLTIISACKNDTAKNIPPVADSKIETSVVIEDSLAILVIDEETNVMTKEPEVIVAEKETVPAIKIEIVKETPQSKKEVVAPKEVLSKKEVTEEVIESVIIDTISSKTDEAVTEVIEIMEKEKKLMASKIPAEKEKPSIAVLTISHDAWNTLLKKYVSDQGNVDYKNFAANAGELQKYLDYLSKNSPQDNWTKKEKLAYYINIYNAGTVKLILDNYPTKSIKDLKNPWGKAIVKIGVKLISLGDIEHKILRKMNEPRIHFAINCASYSCPKLLNKAFTASQMEKQLEIVTHDFVNDTTRNIISENSVELSEIFKWYKKDFTANSSLIDYINTYSQTPIAPNTKTNYLKYDWSLNERK